MLARSVLGTRVVTAFLSRGIFVMPEEKLSSCSHLHGTKFRKRQACLSQWGIRLQEVCPPVSPSPCMSPAGHCKHSMDSGEAQPGSAQAGDRVFCV